MHWCGVIARLLSKIADLYDGILLRRKPALQVS
jgi:hypothetical protein